MTNREARIVIIGAGVAGLSAAHHLIQNDFKNVVVLEATDRIGGRIHTVEFGNGIIEMGANWIHGIGPENSMFTLAESKGQVMEPYVFLDRIEGVWCTDDGDVISSELVEKAWGIFCRIEDEVDRFWQKQIEVSRSFIEFINSSLEKAVEAFEVKDRHLIMAAFNCMINYLCFHFGDELKELSLGLAGMFKTIPGGNVKITNGFLAVLRSLYIEIQNVNIQFGKVVKSVEWKQALAKVKISCESATDEHFIVDHVIVTCSLGYLKSYHDIIFRPLLPKQKIKSISNMGFGKVNKIFLYFEKPFWKIGKGGVKLAWKSKNDEFNASTWYKAIFAFDEVINNPNVLVAWVHGRAAEYMETISDSNVVETCTRLLKKFLKKRIDTPSKVVRSRWCTNTFSCGSYSYFSNWSRPSDIITLAEPLFIKEKPVVCFAGEATHEQFFSTTHGARSSGIREAERLTQYYFNHSKL